MKSNCNHFLVVNLTETPPPYSILHLAMTVHTTFLVVTFLYHSHAVLKKETVHYFPLTSDSDSWFVIMDGSWCYVDSFCFFFFWKLECSCLKFWLYFDWKPSFLCFICCVVLKLAWRTIVFTKMHEEKVLLCCVYIGQCILA